MRRRKIRFVANSISAAVLTELKRKEFSAFSPDRPLRTQASNSAFHLSDVLSLGWRCLLDHEVVDKNTRLGKRGL